MKRWLLEWFQDLFHPLLFEDEEKTRTAKSLNAFSLGAIGALLLLIVLRVYIKAETSPVAILVLLVIVGIMVIVQILMRLGYVRGAATFLVTTSWIALTYQAWEADGVYDVAIVAYFLLILLTSLMLGWIETIVITVASVTTIWVFAYLEQNKYIFPSPDPPFNIARDLTIIFGLAAGLIYLVITSLRLSLRMTRVELKERLRAEEKLQTQARYLTSLNETTLGLMNRLELKPLLESILIRASELLNTTHVGLDLVLPDESALRQELGYGIFAQFDGILTHKNEGLTGMVWGRNETIFASNYREWAGNIPEAVDLGFVSVIGVPLKSGNKVVGTLIVSHIEQGRGFTPDQVMQLERFAALASVAIDNARLYEQLQNELDERRRTEADLRSSEERFRKVFHNELVAICITALDDGRFIEANDAFWKLSQLKPEEALGHTVVDLHLWDSFEERREFTRELVKKKSLQNVGYDFQRANGRVRNTRAFYELIYLGSELCVLAMYYDVTEMKKAELALQQSEERFRRVFHASPVAIVISTLEEGRVLEANDAYWSLTGHDPVASIGKTVSEMGIWETKEERQRFVNKLNRNRSLYNPDYQFINEKGERRATVAFYELIKLETMDCILSMFYDITEQKETREALQKSEARTTALLNAIPDMIFEISRTGTFLDYIPSTELGPLFPPEQFLGKEMRSLFPSTIVDQTMFYLERALDSGQLHAFEYELPVGNEMHYYEARLVPSGTDRVMAMIRDITPRKWAESERESLIQELENKNAELERFTYTVSHDLKSPLITIKGYLGFIEQDTRSGNIPRLNSDMKRISDAADKMQRLLNELLELSRIGRLTNKPEEIPFEALAKEAIELVQGRIQARNIKVKVHKGLPVVYGDRPRLLEVVQNLVDNAAKFMGEQEHPLIEIGQQGAEAGKPIFYVRDNGVGIAPQHFDRVFGLFNKLDTSSDGTGVGLALVKRIIEVHGGRIWVESEPGKGAAFYFCLPAVPKPRISLE